MAVIAAGLRVTVCENKVFACLSLGSAVAAPAGGDGGVSAVSALGGACGGGTWSGACGAVSAGGAAASFLSGSAGAFGEAEPSFEALAVASGCLGAAGS